MRFVELLDREIEELERELETHPAFVKLRALRSARALYVDASQVKHDVAPTAAGPGPRPLAVTKGARSAPMGGKSLEAVNATIEILAASGAPMRTSELMPMLADRGITFAGSAPQNVLSSLLSRSPDVVSKGGHVGWALAAWDSAGGNDPGGKPPPADVEHPSAPVEPGEEVAHDNMN